MRIILKYSLCLLLTGSVLHASGHQTDSLGMVQVDDIHIIDQATQAIFLPFAYELDSLSQTFMQNASLGGVIDASSSVYIKTYNPGGLASISLRGTGANHTQINWNGIRLNSVMNGQTDLNLIPSSFFDQIRITPGGNDGGMGGTVDLIDRIQWSRGSSLSARAGAGSFGTYSGDFTYSNSTDKLTMTTDVSYLSSQNDFEFENTTLIDRPMTRMENADFSRFNLQQHIGYRFDKSVLSAQYWFGTADRSIPPIMTSLNSPFIEKQQDLSHRGLINWKYWSGNLHINASSAYLYDRNEYDHSGLADSSVHHTHAYRNKAVVEWDRWKPLIRVGVYYDLERANSTSLDGVESRHVAGYNVGISSLEFGDVRVRAKVKQEVNGGKWSPVSPMVSVTWKRQGTIGTVLTVSGARNFQFPTFNDLYWVPGGNPDLTTETSWNMDAGFVLDHSGRTKSSREYQAMFRANAFANFVDNWIIWTPVDGGFWSPSNIRKAFARGVETEVEGSYAFSKVMLKLIGSYAFTRATNEEATGPNDQSEGKQLIYQPMHQWNMQAIAISKFVRIAGIVDYTGMRYTSTDNASSLPSYLLVHASIGQELTLNNHRFIWDVAVRNIMDTSYQNIAMRPFPGRHYMFTISYHLNS